MNRPKHTGPAGLLTRRSFLKISAMTGISTWAAAGIGQRIRPLYAAATTARRGGILKVAGKVSSFAHPGEIKSIQLSNIVRQVAECLTSAESDNTITPLLLERWEPNHDFSIWTLILKKDIRFNNGDKLTTEDVAFTLRQWLSLPAESPLRQMFEHYLSPEGIEPSTDLKLRLFLKQPMLDLPANLSHPCAVILNHRTFKGDFLKRPHGTGPFFIQAFRIGERCILKRRKNYWQTGDDQEPLPYLDGVEFIDKAMRPSDQVAALDSGALDILDTEEAGNADAQRAMSRNSQILIHEIPSARTHVLSMCVDQTPWQDNRVRLALKLSQNREKILSAAFMGQGQLGGDFHVNPVHPAHCKRAMPAYQPDRAKALLEQAGYPNGLKAVLRVNPGLEAALRYAEILRETATIAGFHLQIDTSEAPPENKAENPWPLEIMPFPHYPGSTTALNIAYNADPYGYPLNGNKSRWTDTDFSKLLTQANTIADLEARRDIFCRLEDILQQRGPTGIACWLDAIRYTRKRVKGVRPHPGHELHLKRVWISE